MMNDGTDAPAELRPTQPGLGERLAMWGMALILGIIVGVVLRITLNPLVGQQAARTIAKGLSLAVVLEVGNGVRSIRSFLTTAGVCLVAFSAVEWWWY